MLSAERQSRLHIGTHEPLSRHGGLHNYLQGLMIGQRQIGLHAEAFESMPHWRRRRSDVDRILSATPHSQMKLHYHFATSSLPVQYSRLSRVAGQELLHFHGPYFAEGRAHGNSLLRATGKWLLEAAAYKRPKLHLIAASSAFADLLARYFLVPRDSVDVVYPGVDIDRFTPGDKVEARDRLALPQDVFLFSAVRRLVPRMGLHSAIAALARVPDAHLAIAGSGTAEKDLRALAQDSGVGSRVHFLGRVPDDDLPRVYQAADCSLVPTESLEGFGLVVLESLATDTPCLATPVGGLAEALGPFASEWTTEAVGTDALAAAMINVISRKMPAGTCRAYAETQSLAAMARRVESIGVSS